MPPEMERHVAKIVHDKKMLMIEGDVGDFRFSRGAGQGGVEIDGNRLTNPQAKLPKGGPYTIKAGKRAWARATLK